MQPEQPTPLGQAGPHRSKDVIEVLTQVLLQSDALSQNRATTEVTPVLHVKHVGVTTAVALFLLSASLCSST